MNKAERLKMEHIKTVLENDFKSQPIDVWMNLERKQAIRDCLELLRRNNFIKNYSLK